MLDYFLLSLFNLYNNIIQKQKIMHPSNNEKNIYKQMYKSGIHASYFANFKDPKFVQKSKIQISQIQNNDQDKVDQNTFRIKSGFKQPVALVIYRSSSKVYLQGDSFFSCFSKRRVYDMSLANQKLNIKASQRVARFVNFSCISSKVSTKSNGFVIAFEGSPAQLYIQPATNVNKQQQIERWVNLLNQVISNTDGKIKKLNYLTLKSPLDFYKTEQISNQQFTKTANSGDIILFKSQHSAAAVQRLFTDSQYDHVGIILRNKKDQLFIYESASDSGVGLTPWRHMIRYQWYQNTDKICWKKLNIQMTQNDIKIIEGFVAKTLGKQFALTVQKLFNFKSKLERTKQQEQKKTYFCSELVARLYKQLGILDQQKSSTSYYPVDFTDNGALKIIRSGVSLQNQKLIAFDKV